MASFEPLAASAASTIAAYSITPKDYLYIEVAQAEHRINLVNLWRIRPGARILEIGCGQGNCTAVLAEAVGPSGHVDAVDPASPDYGAPFTLRQAQDHMSASAIGDRVTWHRAQPVEFLKANPDQKWDYAVFAHSSWYFDRPEELADMLTAMRGIVGEVLIAEYALTATEKAAEPHMRAAVARATLEAFNETSVANIRNLLSPAAIRDVAQSSGWAVETQRTVVPGAGLLDGHWEVRELCGERFLKEIDEHVKNARLATVLRSARDAVRAAVEELNGAKVRTMDVWVAKFQPRGLKELTNYLSASK